MRIDRDASPRRCVGLAEKACRRHRLTDPANCDLQPSGRSVTSSVLIANLHDEKRIDAMSANREIGHGTVLMETNELILHLGADANPVRRLAAPWLRAALWVTISLPYVVGVAAMNTSAVDSLRAMDARFAVEQAAIFATALVAAMATFSSVVPGRSRSAYLLPLAPMAVWLASLGEGCVHDWIRLGADGLQIESDWRCGPAAIFIGIIPTIAMVTMLRRGAPLTPNVTLALGALAVAALGTFGLRVFHIGDVSIMVLVWHFGSVVLISIIASWIGHHVLNWRCVIVPDARGWSLRP